VTPAAELLQPDSNPALYVSAVLALYVDLNLPPEVRQKVKTLFAVR